MIKYLYKVDKGETIVVYEISDTTKVESLFTGWEETLIYSCIQQVMGKIYVTDVDNPKSACAFGRKAWL